MLLIKLRHGVEASAAAAPEQDLFRFLVQRGVYPRAAPDRRGKALARQGRANRPVAIGRLFNSWLRSPHTQSEINLFHVAFCMRAVAQMGSANIFAIGRISACSRGLWALLRIKNINITLKRHIRR